MKIKNKSRLGIALFTLSVVSLVSVAFSTWVVIEGNFDSINNNLNIEQGTINTVIKGIEISNKTDFKVGRYFYYVNDTHSKTIDLIYTFKVTPSLLGDSFKIANENGYKFSLNCELSLNSQTIFGNASNLDSISFNGSEITPIWQSTYVASTLPFQTLTTGNVPEIFELKFTFNNNLILNYRENILGEKFLLKVYSGG